MARTVALIFIAISLLVFSASAQNQPPSDPQALAYAAQSIAALTGGTAISDVTLSGSVTWNGSDTGTATLRALGTGESRMDLVLTSGTRTEIRDAQTGTLIGEWISPDNSSGMFAYQNCQTDAVWFSPALGSLAAGPNVVLSYLGQETRNGEAVQHLQSYVYQPNQLGLTPSPQQLSTMDLYLDATTLLPAVVTYNAHPDNDASTNLLVEVDFLNYQTVSGVVVPMHVQRYQQGNLMVDVVVTGASFNTGLSLSIFTVN
ncbi:MAG: hypothetical protein ACYDDS_13320 [Candidatus Sulfotelmatobacter sp.]